MQEKMSYAHYGYCPSGFMSRFDFIEGDVRLLHKTDTGKT